MDKPGKNEELGTLVRSTRLAVPNYLSGGVITCLAVDEKLNMAAIGFSNHCLLLLRGDITRDRGTKQKILLDASKPPSKTQSHDTDISKSSISGVSFKSSSRTSWLYVATTDEILLFDLSVRDRELLKRLDNIGCPKGQ